METCPLVQQEIACISDPEIVASGDSKYKMFSIVPIPPHVGAEQPTCPDSCPHLLASECTSIRQNPQFPKTLSATLTLPVENK
ncbi:hypothetical protein GF362_05135 [Candidatus Dojkabacteria bacterium]|nr:hypothetical protein [Candidatus Dojkabacteria bacterium]